MPISRLSLADQIYIELKNDIITQKIPCGERLTLKNLKEKFATSSTPIREAITRLAQDGLVDQISNIGAHVIQIDEKVIGNIYDMISNLDSFAIILAGRNQSEELYQALAENIASQKKAVDYSDQAAYTKYSSQFHDIFYRHSQNPFLVENARKTGSLYGIITNRYADYLLDDSTTCQEHCRIGDTFLGGNASEAADLMLAHFGHAKETVLDRIRAAGE